MQWFAILMTVAGSSVIATIVTIVVGRMESRGLKLDEAPLSALFVCNQLEVYGASCAEVVLGDLSYTTSHGKVGAPAARLAPTPEYSPDVAWKALGANVTNELFNFRAQVIASQRSVSALAGSEDADAVSRECIRQSIGLGLRAYAISKMLRNRYRLPPADLGDDWDPAVALAKWHLELEPSFMIASDEAPARRVDTDQPSLTLAGETYEDGMPYEEACEVSSAHPLLRDAR